jgi:hypothetical protein
VFVEIFLYLNLDPDDLADPCETMPIPIVVTKVLKHKIMTLNGSEL